jgi:hypothetical protein
MGNMGNALTRALEDRGYCRDGKNMPELVNRKECVRKACTL